MKECTLLVRFGELALKGENRGWFEKVLAKNIQLVLEKTFRNLGRTPEEISQIKVNRVRSRILVKCPWSEELADPIIEAVRSVFGLSSFSLMKEVETSYEALTAACIDEAQAYFAKNGNPQGFSVRSRRTDKVLPNSSTEIDRILGSAVLERFPEWPVKLKNAELSIGIEVRKNRSFIWTQKIVGHDGLPVGSNAPLLTLISGGLDSPVAALQVLRRGSATSFVHFFGTPFVEDSVLEKVSALVHLINRYQPKPKPLYIVPFGKLQEKIAIATDPKMRTLLYRRMMIRISSALAHKIHARALVTGESLGQVASQTVENMATINQVATLPILRPLITHTKQEIVEQAHKWKCFDISVQPGVDCCTLFADRHPTLRSTAAMMEAQEAKFPMQEWVKEALESAYVLGPRYHAEEKFRPQPSDSSAV